MTITRTEAQQATQRLQRIADDARNATQKARDDLRELDARWDLDASSKARGAAEIRKTTRQLLDSLDTERAVLTGTVTSHVAQERSLLPKSDASAELRRDRAYRAAEAAVFGHDNAVERSIRFVELVNDAEASNDTTTLEALRELGRHLTMRGVDVDPATTKRLDVTAGPPETISALLLGDHAEDCGQAGAITVGFCRQVLDESPSRESELLGVNSDGSTFRIDDWQPPTERVVLAGARSVQE